MSKRIKITALAIFMTGAGLTAAPGAEKNKTERKAKVLVRGIQPQRGGTLLVMVFRRSGFPVQHGRAVYQTRVAVKGKRVSIRVPVPRRGEFAVKILHDENGDGKVNKRMGFIPREGMGFSNGARLRFGPPKFNRARLDAAKFKGPIRITMQYL